MYSVKEIFYTLQGEGANAGRAAVFCRFSGCNLWSGREVDRGHGAGSCSQWCDTDFVGTDGNGGGRFKTAGELAQAIRNTWPGPWRSQGSSVNPLVVFTGGEPLLQLTSELAHNLARDFEIAVETNGTIWAPWYIDWLCVSPKAGTNCIVERGQELKLVYPQPGMDPAKFEGLGFNHFYLQPMDGPDLERNTRLALQYCLEHPQWKLSLQIHKQLDIR